MDLYANMGKAEKRERLAKTCCYTFRGGGRGEAGEYREEGEEKGEERGGNKVYNRLELTAGSGIAK